MFTSSTRKLLIMAELHETGYGRRLLEHDMPTISRSLETIAKELKRIADINENSYLEGKKDQSFLMSQHVFNTKLRNVLLEIKGSILLDEEKLTGKQVVSRLLETIGKIKSRESLNQELPWDKK